MNRQAASTMMSSPRPTRSITRIPREVRLQKCSVSAPAVKVVEKSIAESRTTRRRPSSTTLMLLCCNLDKVRLREEDDDESTVENDESSFGSTSGSIETWEFEFDEDIDIEDHSVSTMSSSSSCISDSESESDNDEYSWQKCDDKKPRSPYENYADCSGEPSLLTVSMHNAEPRRCSCHIGRISATTTIGKILLIRETGNLTPDTASISSSSDFESVDTFAHD